jgi:ABC-type arginine transport system permease subunit
LLTTNSVRRVTQCIENAQQRDEAAFEAGRVRRLFKPNFPDVMRKALVHIRNGCLSDFKTIALYQVIPDSYWVPVPGGHRFQV